jgi:predicted transposase/invertase (TIGR01784 family)
MAARGPYSGKEVILWLRLIKSEREDEVEMLAAKSPEIKDTYEVLKKLSADEEVRLLYESREKAIRDEQARLYGATLKGEQRKAVEIAKNLLSDGISPEVVAKNTGLSIEDVRSL